MKKLLSILLFSCTIASAETYDLWWQQIPAVCGQPNEVTRYIEDNNFQAVHMSLGRQGSDSEGEPVYMITYYENEKQDQTLVTVDIPSALETCIVYRTFNKTEVNIKPKSNT